jgi:peptide/nickel transport system substrate-binding protein
LENVPAEQYGDHPYVQNPDVALGPLRLARYEVDEFIELEGNPAWWGEHQLKIDRIILYQSEREAHINRALAGEQDIVMRGLRADDLALFEDKDFLRLAPVQSLGWLALEPNMRDRPYMTQELRQAIAYAIDKDALNELLYAGQATKVDSIILGPEWAIPDDLNHYDRDLDKARELLAATNWDANQTLVMLVFDAESLLEPALQQMLGEAGIKVELSLRSFTDAANIFREGDYDLAVSGGGSAAADPSLSGSYVACDGSGTETLGYCNPELDELFLQGMSVPDIESRQPFYHDAARILNEELPYIPIFRTPLFYVINNRLQGITPASSVDDLTWDIFEWDVME